MQDERGELKAVVLVAGLGSRLRPLTDDRPKCLVEVGGRPLLAWLLEQLAAAGVTEAVLVTGYREDALLRFLEHTPPPLPVQTRYNALHASHGNGHSLLVARPLVEGAAFLKLDGDLVLADELLPRFLRQLDRPALLLDRSVQLGEEEMKVQVDEAGRVVALGKWLEPGLAAGESIGVEWFPAAEGPRLFAALDRVIHREGQHGAYYEDVYHRLIQEGWPMAAVSTAGLPWTEVDTPEDLQVAARLVATRSQVR